MSVKIDNKKILTAALYVAEREGFINMKRGLIAEYAKCSVGKVSNAYGTMIQLRRAVMCQAINQKVLPVIADGIVLRMKCCDKLDEELRKDVVQYALN